MYAFEGFHPDYIYSSSFPSRGPRTGCGEGPGSRDTSTPSGMYASTERHVDPPPDIPRPRKSRPQCLNLLQFWGSHRVAPVKTRTKAGVTDFEPRGAVGIQKLLENLSNHTHMYTHTCVHGPNSRTLYWSNSREGFFLTSE